jgi:signal transduction histidine kinase
MDRVFDRVLLARHFALSLGAAAAYVFRTELRIGYVALWIVGISVSLNFAAYLFRTRPGLARVCTVASPIIGVGGWTALIGVTNGVASPFIAGLWLEIVLSAMALQLRGIVVVTAACVMGLWLQQPVFVGLYGQVLPMVLQSGFLIGMGAATYLVTRRWTTRQAQMSLERMQLGERLDALNRELEDERIVAALGENVARLAHGLKNTVHSLRGFVGLIEPKLDKEGGGRAALQGLRSAIDDLESLARLTLGTGEKADGRGTEPTLVGAGDVEMPSGVAHALGEVSNSHPGVTWELRTDGALVRVALPDASLSETLVILMRNAVEAMEGEGRGTIETRVVGEELCISVIDEGPGFAGTDLPRIFKPGFTTKKEGSGYGLYLAMRLIEEQGGSIVARNREGGGAAIEIRLPVTGA